MMSLHPEVCGGAQSLFEAIGSIQCETGPGFETSKRITASKITIIPVNPYTSKNGCSLYKWKYSCHSAVSTWMHPILSDNHEDNIKQQLWNSKKTHQPAPVTLNFFTENIWLKATLLLLPQSFSNSFSRMQCHFGWFDEPTIVLPSETKVPPKSQKTKKIQVLEYNKVVEKNLFF